MSKQRAKGTAGENYFLGLLRLIWPHAERAPLKGVLDAGDFTGVPFPVEAKNFDVPRFPLWLRKIRPKANDHRWVLLWKGDMRTTEGAPTMTVDLRFGLELLQLWERRHKTNGRPPAELEGQGTLWP